MIEVRFEELSYVQFDRRAVRSAMGRAARAMTAKLRGSVKGSSGRGSAYSPSAPGEPPRRYSGELLRSMRGRASRRGYALVVSAVAPHAHRLELGQSRMDPRPYFAPSFSDRDVVIGLLRNAYDRAITATPGAPGRPPKTVEVN